MAATVAPSSSTSSRLPSGHTYSYVHIQPKDDKPYILFLHGFPDSSYGWRKQIPFFEEKGYGLVVPDLLGYGGTDKPTELEAYTLKNMCDEIISLLDLLGVKQVISVGHDWGCNLQSRLANYYPSRFSKFVWIDVGYRPPSPFDLDGFNKLSTEKLGYPIFAYLHFFNDEDAGEVMDKHPESVNALRYGGPKFLKERLCEFGATRKFFESGESTTAASWVTPGEVKTVEKIFEPSNGGYEPSLRWFKAAIRHLNDASDSAIPKEDHVVKQPTLLITAAQDSVAVPAMQEMFMRPAVPNLTVKSIDASHWVQLEKADEVNDALLPFITS